jgi:hypothetical protein
MCPYMITADNDELTILPPVLSVGQHDSIPDGRDLQATVSSWLGYARDPCSSEQQPDATHREP